MIPFSSSGTYSMLSFSFGLMLMLLHTWSSLWQIGYVPSTFNILQSLQKLKLHHHNLTKRFWWTYCRNSFVPHSAFSPQASIFDALKTNRIWTVLTLLNPFATLRCNPAFLGHSCTNFPDVAVRKHIPRQLLLGITEPLHLRIPNVGTSSGIVCCILFHCNTQGVISFSTASSSS